MVLLALSLLVRETGVVFVVVLAIWTVWRQRDRRGGLIMASALLPLGAWRLYVTWRLFPDFHWDGLFYNPKTLGMPFTGALELWQHLQAGQFAHVPDQARAGIYFPLLLIGALLVAAWLLWKRPTALTASAAVYALMGVSLTYAAVWISATNAERTATEVFLWLIVIFVTIDRRMWRARSLLGGFMVCALLYLWFGAVGAPLVRYVVLSSLS